VFLDGDDALAPTCLQRRAEVMKSNPTVNFAVFPTWVFRAILGGTRLFWKQFTTANEPRPISSFRHTVAYFRPDWEKNPPSGKFRHSQETNLRISL
jgi:hypothetical protein